MKITFLGTGGVFDYQYGNSAALVEHRGKTFLIDCGPSIYPTLRQHGLTESIDYILLTHLHGDHVGSLFSLVLDMNTRQRPGRRAPILYARESFRDHVERFLACMLGDPSSAVEFRTLDSVEGVGALDTTGHHAPGILSNAYYFVEGDALLYYSGDLADVSVSATFLAGRCERNIRVFHEIHHRKGSLHTYYRDLMDSLSGYKVYGYHCDSRQLPADNTISLVSDDPALIIR